MYTQCPECDVAFRVTAAVLKQAAGKVRCGGCGVAFNALLHLSEELPATSVPTDPEPYAPEIQAPQLEADLSSELEAGAPPKSISAAQSAALLKTLDQLAGDDIRIEDTGIEWRVLDPDEEEGEDAFDDDAAPTMAHKEMRFDDNTPLPDDFDLDALSSPAPEPVVEIIESPRSIEDSQVDLAFGEPDEWEDLLDDLEEAAAALDVKGKLADAVADPVDGTDISVELAAPRDIEEIEAAAAAPTDEPLDMDTQFAIQAEAMGIDLSGMHARLDGIEPEAAVEVEVDAEEERETSIDEDLIAAAFEAEAAVAPEDLSRAGILDEDDYLEVITEEAPEEVLEEVLENVTELEPELEPKFEEALGEEFEDELEALQGELEEEDIAEEVLELEESDAEALEDETLEDEALEDELLEDDEPEVDIAAAGSEEEIEAELEHTFQDFNAEEDNFDDALEKFSVPDVIEVPKPTEEELTINMMIDQDLLAIAMEDDDGFTSTIVQKQISSKEDIPAEGESHDQLDDTVNVYEESISRSASRSNPLVETIIMEGDFAHSEEDLVRRDAAKAAASASLKKSDAEKEKNKSHNWEPPRYGMLAAAVVLFVVLVIQVIHHSREAFATSSIFQSTVGPIYRMVGSPVTPAWDINGWRFEATKGSTSEEEQVLTIYSRIGNTSPEALPYPLVHVSLTDRFEEIIGSRVLEPAEYLVGNADPRRPVAQGSTFDAVFTIDTPSAEATGFKLNVCYRLTSGQLRCAIEDFK